MKYISIFCMLLAVLFSSSVNAEVGAPKRVHEILYIGASQLSPRDLAPLLPIGPGEAWRPSLNRLVQDVLLEYYQKRGFYQAKIDVLVTVNSTNGVILTIKIDEGKPCLIKSIWVDDPPDIKSKSVLTRFKNRMQDILQINRGDRYDEAFVTDRVRELREWLVAENYILANTDKVRLNFNDDRSEIEVVFLINFGDRVTFGFQGNSVFSKGELNEFITGVRTTGLGKDYLGAIQRKFTEEYRARAYNDIKITPKIVEIEKAKHVTFVFDEGVRTELVDIRWDGLSEQNVPLANEAFKKGVSRLLQRGYFVEKDFDKGVLLVIEDLRSRGYLSSKLVAKSVQPVVTPSGVRKVKTVVQLSEGEHTTIDQIILDGVNYFSVEKVNSTLEVKEGASFNPFALEEGLQHLKAFYISEGFLDFKFLSKDSEIVRFTENNRSAKISLKVFEGPRIKVGEIKLAGLKQTKDFVVEREVTMQSGEWWVGSRVQDIEINLRKLGIFTEVKISPVPSARGSDFRDMVIDLKEAEPGIIEAGPGFRSDLGIRTFARLSYNNILGRNWLASISGEANRRLNNEYRFVEYKFDASFIEPRFFSTKNLYSFDITTKKQRFPGPSSVNSVATQLTTGFQRKIAKILSAKLIYGLERIRQFDAKFNNLDSPSDNRSILIGSITPGLSLDTRDSPFTTTRGILSTISLEYANPALSGQQLTDVNAPDYQKWTGSIHGYIPVTKDIIWSNVFSAGFLRSNSANREVPLIKLFRLGGYNTIRGFPEDSITTVTINSDKATITGTLTLLNFRSQVDIPLIGDLKLAPFIDAGNLFIDKLQNSPFFRAGAGVGLHYMTPVGPINLDYGQKLNPINGENPYQVHFSVGLI